MGVRRPIGMRLLSAASFGFVWLFLLAAALPAVSSVSASAVISGPGTRVAPQSFTNLSEAPDAAVARDGYGVTSRAELLRQQYTLSYTTTWSGPIRWPFPVPVRISDGFGPRAAPCEGCSTYHTAVDFVPGTAQPIYAIADGVVREHVDGAGSWGNYVILEHQINGQTVVSSYAHMQRGSSPLVPGETVQVGDFIGLVGATGQVTGAHLHFELEVASQLVDPFAWLTANAG
ncbi:MAG: M23 family metallopeptidase [Cryobacterium sp.]|nr:M23 family metallopeptidase [Cryobacterium sp.]